MGGCVRCGGAAGGLSLCNDCTVAFKIELADVAGILPTAATDGHGRVRDDTLLSLPEELDVSLSRQDQLTDPQSPGGGTEIPLIFKAHVGEAAWVLHSTLRVWAGDFGGDTTLAPRHLARWFLTNLDLIRRSSDAAVIVDEITEAVHQARRSIDRPSDDRVYLGPCGATTLSHNMGADVSRKVGAVSVTNPCTEELYGQPWLDRTICEHCGTEYRIEDRKDWLRERANQHQGTSVEVAGFLKLTGVACTPAQIRGYAHRKRLEPSGVNDHGHPTYLISDVLTVIRDRYARRVTPTAHAG
ncbi:MAG: hypothetical protein ACREQ5_00255 [Candidatus Dormibacteria bacterium]